MDDDDSGGFPRLGFEFVRKRIDNHLVIEYTRDVCQRLLLGEGRGGYLAEIEIRTSGACLEFGDGFGSVFLYYFSEIKNGITTVVVTAHLPGAVPVHSYGYQVPVGTAFDYEAGIIEKHGLVKSNE